MPDRYWQEVIDALQKAPAPATAGPEELKRFVPELISFAQAHALPQRIVCHKGEIDRLPASLLAACFGRARVSFANEVFVIFEIGEATDPHVRALELKLAERFEGSPTLAAPLLRRQPRRHRTAPRVVAALQAPALLDLWSASSSWRLEVAELGDHETERSTTRVSRWDGKPDDVVAVLVTTPAQLLRAEKLLPEAAKLWVLHKGSANMLPMELLPRVDGIVTLSRKVLDIQRALHWELLGKPGWVLPPAYQPVPSFTWKPAVAWTMQAAGRKQVMVSLVDQTIALIRQAGHAVTVYGDGMPGGFLDEATKSALYAACSCYVSPLPPWAGFGLSQHECFAAGVPVAGLAWGDLPEEMSAEYTGLAGTLDEVAEAAVRLCDDEGFARNLSVIGLDYIATHRTARNMNDAVERLVSELPR